MTGPAIINGPKHFSKELEQAIEGRSGWDFLEKQLMPALVHDSFRPENRVLDELARYAETEVGREVIAWLRSISDGAPYPRTGFGTLETTALAAAKHEGRAAVGHALALAIAEGQRLRKQG